jgi:hypothetical protein
MNEMNNIQLCILLDFGRKGGRLRERGRKGERKRDGTTMVSVSNFNKS